MEVWIYEFSDENYEQDNLLDQHYLFSKHSINGKFAGFLCYKNYFKENLTKFTCRPTVLSTNCVANQFYTHYQVVKVRVGLYYLKIWAKTLYATNLLVYVNKSVIIVSDVWIHESSGEDYEKDNLLRRSSIK